MTEESTATISRLRLTDMLLGVLTVIAVGTVLHMAQSVILPLIIAWLLSYIVGPVVSFLTRRKIPLGFTVLLILILLLWVFYLLATFLHGRIMAFMAVYPEYAGRLQGLIDTMATRFERASDPLATIDWGAKIYGFLVPISGSLLTFLSNLLLVMIFLVFMLLGKPYFGYKVKKAFSKEQATKITTVMASISRQIGGYLSIQVLISLATAFFVWVALRIIGVDFAVTWAALTFLLNFIPTIGSIVAGIPPVLLAVVQFYPSPWQPAFTLAALLAIQISIGNFISPKVMGERLNLSPVVVLVSLLFWGWLWGIVGALLSVPIASAIKIVCENIEPLRPISVLMGAGKPLKHEYETS